MNRFRKSAVGVLVLLTLLLVSLNLLAQAQPEQGQTEEEWIQMKAEQGDSHASGMRPELGPVILGNPTQAVVVLRVGLYASTFNANGTLNTEYASLNHTFADISNTAGDVHVLDEATGKQIIAITAGQIVRVSFDSTLNAYQVAVDGNSLGDFAGPIFFKPSDSTNMFRVESIRRSFSGVKVPLYRGAIEISRGRSTAANRVNVVNFVSLEDYVPGVVVNESISSFGIEALKAQAVAARGYAAGNIGNYINRGYPFDIVDSSSSQVYRGVISEHVKAVQASQETSGLVASYQGKIISAMYSSSMGGHTDSYEWSFNSPSSQLPGTQILPYLHYIYDGDGTPPDFSTEEGVAAFWTANPVPTIYDDCIRIGNSFSRWKIRLTAADIKARFTSMASRIVVVSGDTSGTIQDVAVTLRMPSGRAAIVRITLTSGVVEVRGWDNLRNVLGRTAVAGTPRACGTSTIANNFTLNNPSVIEQVKKLDGTLDYIFSYGGGWGHNVGMSQYGSNGRAKAGQTFQQILKAYYTGVDIGSHPIDIGRNPGSGVPTLRQSFYAPNAIGRLVIRPTDLKGLRVHINALYDLSFTADDLATDELSVDITPYLVQGMNTVQYNPVGRDGKATVMVEVD
ncbi:MAG TPA: SpoIID/LytB domain-containing protein [Terriglobales bacterium]|nr:SpoIID/LytB domain-containing protein [Terriglobales bacterium]